MPVDDTNHFINSSSDFILRKFQHEISGLLRYSITFFFIYNAILMYMYSPNKTFYKLSVLHLHLQCYSVSISHQLHLYILIICNKCFYYFVNKNIIKERAEHSAGPRKRTREQSQKILVPFKYNTQYFKKYCFLQIQVTMKY